MLCNETKLILCFSHTLSWAGDTAYIGDVCWCLS